MFNDPSAEQTRFRQQVLEFVETEVKPQADHRFKEGKFPLDIYKKMYSASLLNIGIPAEYGGGGQGCRGFTILSEEIAIACALTAVTIIPYYQVAMALLMFGTEEQKAKFLFPLIQKGKIASFAVTEQLAGSDVRSMQTRATLEEKGYIINGSKSYITNGSSADIFIVFTKTSEDGLTAFILERGHPGFTVDGGVDSIGLRSGQHVTLMFNNCIVSTENLLGQVGKGLNIILRTLNYSRIGAASISIGIGRAAFEEALKYARGRTITGKSIIDFQGWRWRLAESATMLDAAVLLRDKATFLTDQGINAAKEAAMAKLHASRFATKLCLESMQMVGAPAVIVGSPFERYLLDAKSYELAGGSGEVLLNTVATLFLKEWEAKYSEYKAVSGQTKIK